MRHRATTATGVAGFFPKRRGWWRLVLLIVILVTIAGYVSPVRSYYERSRQISAEKEITASLTQEHDRLQTEKDRLQNQAYVEQVARKDLGLVKPGEQSYVLKNLDQGKEAEATPVPPQQKSPLDSFLDTLGSMVP